MAIYNNHRSSIFYNHLQPSSHHNFDPEKFPLRNNKKNILFTFAILLIVLPLMLFGCGSSDTQIVDSDMDTLQEIWLKSRSFRTRKMIIAEMEYRKAIDPLISCLLQAGSLYSQKKRIRKISITITDKDVIIIVDSLGRLKNPRVIGDLASIGYINNDNIRLAVLKAFMRINDPKAVMPTCHYLKSTSYDIRWQALDTLAHLKDPGAAESIYPLLFEKNDDIRWKAVLTLGEIGNPDAVNRLSLMLADHDSAVRGVTETVLKEKFNVSDATIQNWKSKAAELAGRRLSIEGVYQSDIEYQKAKAEIKALKSQQEGKLAAEGNKATAAVKTGIPKYPPALLISSPTNGLQTESKHIRLMGEAIDEKGLKNLDIIINGRSIKKKGDRGIELTEGKYPLRVKFDRRISLIQGKNKVQIRATDTDDLLSTVIISVDHIERRRNVWAVVIGINDYPRIRKLKYAVNDAKVFYDLLVETTQIPAENVFLMINGQANLQQLRSTLGTRLKNKAGKDDMVIIYFAGHGATERDMMSPDGDGLEKYLLPYDADPNDLYASALPMREIAHIFHRIRSERLIFIADACYSGASGGRTVSITGVRANLSDAFLERIAGGKGKIIITASSANEVSVEKDELRHGVFTYYLVEGLRGRADSDQDGLVTVDEAYRYVSDKVTQATGQEQHPVKKGSVEGQLVISVVQ